MSMRKLVFAIVLAFTVVFTVSAGGGGQARGREFPTRPIRVMVPWAAGGSSDIKVRAIADLSPTYFGVPMIVVNRDGAGGTIGAAEFARMAPDGYNVCMLTSGVFVTQPLMREVQYELDDFEFIIGLSYEPFVMLVHVDSPWNSVEELVAYGRRTGRRLFYGGAGIGSFGHMTLAAFFGKAGLDAEAVAFGGGGPTVTALLGRHIDVASVHPPEALPHVEAGQLRMLGIFSAERCHFLPELRDVPTFREMGYDIDMAVSKFFVVPRGTPREIQERLYQGFSQIMRSERFVRFAEGFRLEVRAHPGHEALRLLREDIVTTGAVMRELGLAIR